MVSQFLLVFLLLSIVSNTYSSDSDSSEDEYSDTIDRLASSLFIGRDGSKKEIKLNKYFGSVEFKKFLDSITMSHSDIVQKHSIGTSAVDTRDIWAVRISHRVNFTTPLKPAFKFVANIHGYDTVGYALMVSLIQYLLYSDGVDDRITHLLDTIDVWIVPTLNPDGLYSLLDSWKFFDAKTNFGNFNKKGVDLDQNFLHFVPEMDWILEPETRSMLYFMQAYPFVLSGNIQGGAIMVSYPFDYLQAYPEKGILHHTPDHELFKQLSSTYAKFNTMIQSRIKCNTSLPLKTYSYVDYVANGYSWRKNRGSMQDANYIFSNCFEITMHLSCKHYTPASDLPRHWHANFESMLNFIESTRQGVYGFVKSTLNKTIKGAVITVEGNDKDIKVTESGEYWRLLPYEEEEWKISNHTYYNVTASAPAAISCTKRVLLTKDHSYVRLDFELSRQGFSGKIYDENTKNRVGGGVIIVKKQKEKKSIKIEVTRKGDYGRMLGPGEYELTAEAFGYKTLNGKVNLTKSKPYLEIDFHLVHKAGVYGEVKDIDGNSIPEAVISIKSDSNKIMKPVKPNENGQYWMKLVPNLTVAMTAEAPGYESKKFYIKLCPTKPSKEVNFELSFNMIPHGVYGLVVDTAGYPVPGAVIYVDGKELKVSARGAYSRRLYLGRHKVTASAPGYKTQRKPVLLTENETLAELNFILVEKQSCLGF